MARSKARLASGPRPRRQSPRPRKSWARGLGGGGANRRPARRTPRVVPGRRMPSRALAPSWPGHAEPLDSARPDAGQFPRVLDLDVRCARKSGVVRLSIASSGFTWGVPVRRRCPGPGAAVVDVPARLRSRRSRSVARWRAVALGEQRWASGGRLPASSAGAQLQKYSGFLLDPDRALEAAGPPTAIPDLGTGLAGRVCARWASARLGANGWPHRGVRGGGSVPYGPTGAHRRPGGLREPPRHWPLRRRASGLARAKATNRRPKGGLRTPAIGGTIARPGTGAMAPGRRNRSLAGGLLRAEGGP
jgi:hypothetical protein